MSETIEIKKDTLWKVATLVLAVVVVVMFVRGDSGPAPTVTGNAVKNPGSLGDNSAGAGVDMKTLVDDDAILGNKNAPVTIVEFSDYQCPFCRRFWTETFHQIKENYIDTGKVRFVYRDFPLSFHPAAQKAAETAECVREEGGDAAYFEMHDKIFMEGNILDGGDAINGPVRGTAQFGEAELKQWAKDIGYNIDNCLDSGKMASEVAKDMRDGQAAGVTGTPGFLINGKLVSGAQPYSVFQQTIEAELA